MGRGIGKTGRERELLRTGREKGRTGRETVGQREMGRVGSEMVRTGRERRRGEGCGGL